MDKPKIFISYSHDDWEEMQELLTHLEVLKSAGICEPWTDEKIKTGDKWRTDISDAMDNASLAILLISANFLTSKFILDEEVKRILERNSEGMKIFPILLKDCAWETQTWLEERNFCKIEGKLKPVDSLEDHEVNSFYKDITTKINKILLKHREKLSSPQKKKICLVETGDDVHELKNLLVRLFDQSDNLEIQELSNTSSSKIIKNCDLYVELFGERVSSKTDRLKSSLASYHEAEDENKNIMLFFAPGLKDKVMDGKLLKKNKLYSANLKILLSDNPHLEIDAAITDEGFEPRKTAESIFKKIQDQLSLPVSENNKIRDVCIITKLIKSETDKICEELKKINKNLDIEYQVYNEPPSDLWNRMHPYGYGYVVQDDEINELWWNAIIKELINDRKRKTNFRPRTLPIQSKRANFDGWPCPPEKKSLESFLDKVVDTKSKSTSEDEANIH